MIEKVKSIYIKYREQILYLIFGGVTTLITIITYNLLYEKLNLSNNFANVVAWVLSVTFAYITNRKFVFESRNKNKIEEAFLFYGSRLLSGTADFIIMYYLVDIKHINWETLAKAAVNIIIVILNYILSKLIVFKKNGKKK